MATIGYQTELLYSERFQYEGAKDNELSNDNGHWPIQLTCSFKKRFTISTRNLFAN